MYNTFDKYEKTAKKNPAKKIKPKNFFGGNSAVWLQNDFGGRVSRKCGKVCRSFSELTRSVAGQKNVV